MKNKWTLFKVDEISEIKGRGTLLHFIPKENGIEFEKQHPFKVEYIVVYESKEYPILGIESFARAFHYDTEPFGFLIKEL